MNGKYLLDTNIVIDLLNGDERVKAWLTAEKEIFVPSIVVGELYFGVHKSSRKAQNIRKLEDFIITASVLEVTTDTGKRYGEVKHALKKRGTPIPENDIWIAALAVQHGLTVVTRDTHFNNIEKLRLELMTTG